MMTSLTTAPAEDLDPELKQGSKSNFSSVSYFPQAFCFFFLSDSKTRPEAGYDELATITKTVGNGK